MKPGRMVRRVCAKLRDLFAGWATEEERVTRSLHVEAHPLTTEVRLELDRERRLRFTSLEAMKLKKRTGISVWTGEGTPDGVGLDIGAIEIDQLLELLAICCEHEDPKVTAEALAPHVSGESLMEVVAALMILVGDFLPEVGEENPENPLMAGALIRLMNGSTGRSPRRRWGSTKTPTGASPHA